MCLKVTTKSKTKTARRPILTWKWVRNDISVGCWNSPYYHTNVSHPFNKVMNAQKESHFGIFPNTYLYISDLIIETNDDISAKGQWVPVFLPWDKDVVGYVYEGFHSFTSWKEAKRDAGIPRTILKPCIIPKGAKYIKGKDRQVASTKIVVFDSWKSLVKYILVSKK